MTNCELLAKPVSGYGSLVPGGPRKF
jgi:hypothetical protein